MPSKTQEQTIEIHALGPNLGKGASFHIHAAGCADVTKSRTYAGADHKWDRENTYTVASMRELVTEVLYPADEFEYDADDWASYAGDIKVFPCVKGLPQEAAKAEPKGPTKIRTIRISDELWEAAQAEAAERGESVTDAIRRALVRYSS